MAKKIILENKRTKTKESLSLVKIVSMPDDRAPGKALFKDARGVEKEEAIDLPFFIDASEYLYKPHPGDDIVVSNSTFNLIDL